MTVRLPGTHRARGDTALLAEPLRRRGAAAGPHVLVEGPAEIDLPDGRRVVPEPPVTAFCVCGRRARCPICDTSHRTRRPTEETP